ncbi:MAG: penicillin-binding transpeptidase domain-containing protein [Bacilli bacterium]
MKNKTNVTLKVMQLVTLFFFLCLFLLLGKVMLFDQKKHENNLLLLTNKEVLGESAPRGRIYDRNHKLLVDNMACKVIKYQKSKKITVKKEIELAYELSKIIDLDLQKLTIRSKKDFYLVTKVQETKSLITAAEWELYYRKLLSNKDIEDLKIDRITDQMLKEFTKEDEKAAHLYYLMNKGYSYDEKTIKRNITNEEYAYIAEHASSVGGFFVDTSWERIYLYGDTFRPLLGTVSSEEDGIPLYRIKDLKEKGYALNDRIGISYLEKEYEDYLRGEKALYKINSNYHKELKKAAVRGNDLVLTIDIDLQRDVENILKEEIVKAKLEPNTKYYDHSYVILTDPLTGEILAISGKKLNDFEIVDYTTGILTNPVTAGSVVKGASILVGYDTKVLKIGDVIKDECIKIANTPKKCSWKTLGDVNDIKALAMSSNIYQFKVAMKVANANYQYNQPLKIDEKAFSIYRDMYNRFGLGVKTEIDLPKESSG